MSKHRLADGILYVQVPVGNIHEEGAAALVRELDDLIARDNDNRPTPILADITGRKDIGVTIAPGRKVFSAWLKEGRCSRAAVVGASLFVRTITTFIFRLAGHEDRVRFFKDEAGATAWLRGA